MKRVGDGSVAMVKAYAASAKELGSVQSCVDGGEEQTIRYAPSNR
jgi:hypothetical protein